MSEVRKVMGEVIPRVRAAGKNVGVGGNNPADAAGVAEFIKLGANLCYRLFPGADAPGSRGLPQAVDEALQG